MQAVIKITSSEFNEELFQKIKSLLKGRKASITIAVQDENNFSVMNEDAEAYWGRLQQSVADIETGAGNVFTMKELETFIKK